MITIEAYILENCYFSEKALYRLNSLNIKKHLKITKVTQKTKDKYKKENKMNTFPQIFIKNGKTRYKIGGSTDLDNIERMVEEIKKYEFSIKEFCLFNDLLTKKK